MDEETVVFKLLVHHRGLLYPVVAPTYMFFEANFKNGITCLLYTSPSPRDLSTSRMPSSA